MICLFQFAFGILMWEILTRKRATLDVDNRAFRMALVENDKRPKKEKGISDEM